MKQLHSYWTRASYVAIEDSYAADVKMADLILPDDLCIVRVEMLKNLDAPADLADRLKIAEAAYYTVLEELAKLKESINAR